MPPHSFTWRPTEHSGSFVGGKKAFLLGGGKMEEILHVGCETSSPPPFHFSGEYNP